MRSVPALFPASCLWLVCTLARADPAPTAPSGAAPAAPRLSFVWNAPDGCPAPEAVVSRTENLLGRPAETSLAAPLAIEATVSQLGERSWELQLRSGAPSAAPRRVSASSCDELAEMAALFTALSIDPTLRVEPTPAFADMSAWARADADAAANANANTAANTEGTALDRGTLRVASRVPPQRADEPATSHPGPAASTRLRVRPLAGASVALALGRLPGAAMAVSAEAGITVDRLSVRGQLGYFPERHASVTPTAGGDISLATAGARAAYALTQDSPAIAAFAGATFGWMHGTGTGVTHRNSGDAFLVAAEPGVRAGFALSRSWVFVADLAIAVTINRPGFVLEGIGEVYRPPRFGARFGLGAEWCLP